MKVVSCIAVASVEDEEPGDDLVLCQCELLAEKLPDSEEEVGRLIIEEIVVSEGNEIHRKRSVSCGDLFVFYGTEDEKRSLKSRVWFELVRFLTGHRVQVASLKDKVEFSRWVCDAQEGGKWSLIMELESEGIVRKIAQLELESVTQGEVDLFQMTNTLFQSYCSSNDSIEALRSRGSDLEVEIATLREQREILDKVLYERDEKTRAIMVSILNEKKKRIALLEEELGKRHSSTNLSDVSDSDVINKNVKDAVSHLISPGKRRYRNDQAVKDSSVKNAKRRLLTEPKIESAQDFEDDFQFFGITKPKEEYRPSGSSTPKKLEVKLELQEEKVPEIDSQRSDPIRDSVEDISQAETETDTETEPTHVLKHESDSSQPSSSQPGSESESETDTNPEDIS